MYAILDFFVNNYVWFLIICLILIFALIGYFVDTKKDERFENKVELDQELKSKLEAADAANMTLNQMVGKEQATVAPTEVAPTEAPAAPAEVAPTVAPTAPATDSTVSQ